jgi:hypothetical protein
MIKARSRDRWGFTRRWLLALQTIALLVFATQVRASDKELHQMPSDDLQRRGTELRVALDQTYRKLVDEQAIKPLQGADATDMVERFIPLGTSFDDAEAILKSAGFRLDPRPGPIPPRLGFFGVSAVINPFSQGFLSATNLDLTLYPKSPGDYTSVAKISASFFISYP